MRRQLRIGSAACWALAWALALGGVLLYLLSPSSVEWWVGVLSVVPLVALAEWRRETKGFERPYGDGPDGPWLPSGP